MDLGLSFALMAAVNFTMAQVLIRKGTFLSGESFTSVLISASVGLVFFSIAVPFTSGWNVIWSASWRSLILLSTGGILHFVAGRFLVHNAIRLIGANKASAIGRTQMLYPVVLGVVLLKESLSIFLVMGVALLLSGAILVGMERKDKVLKTSNYKGIAAAVLGALCWGISGVVLKPGIQEIGSPFAAAFISYVATALVMVLISLGKVHREQIKNLQVRPFLVLASSSFFTSLAHLARFAALRISPVSVVDPLILSVNGLFIIAVSFVINRNIEVFTWRVLMGTVVTVVGAYLLIL